MKNEFEKIRMILEQVKCSDPQLLIGAGDDGAVFKNSSSSTVVSTDVNIEGVHFRKDWVGRHGVGWFHFGQRAVLCALSDLAAMGASSRWVLSSLILPNNFSDAALKEWTSGAIVGARSVGAEIIGGNLGNGAQFSSTMTVIGVVDENVIARSGAKPGDGVFVTGEIGSAALGLSILLREENRLEDAQTKFVKRFLFPPVEKIFSCGIGSVASAGIDISDGLYQDLSHLCDQSGVGVDIHLDQIPVDDEFLMTAEKYGLDPIQLMLTSGEDYQLLFTSSDTQCAQKVGVQIGQVSIQQGIRIYNADGSLSSLNLTGFDHFSH